MEGKVLISMIKDCNSLTYEGCDVEFKMDIAKKFFDFASKNGLKRCPFDFTTDYSIPEEIQFPEWELIVIYFLDCLREGVVQILNDRDSIPEYLYGQHKMFPEDA